MSYINTFVKQIKECHENLERECVGLKSTLREWKHAKEDIDHQNIHQRLQELKQSKGFQNWMKCVTAQNETRKALCEVVEVKLKGYISQMTDEERDHIETFLECLKCAKIETLKVEQKMSCNHSVCASILQNLLQLCVNQPQPNNDEASGILSSDSCYHQYWHIAKLYICAEDVIATTAGLKGLDLSFLCGMMNNCQLFAFDGSGKTYNTICEDRDELFKSSDNHITDERRGIMLEHMSNLLSHFSGSRLKLCEDVIGDIQQIEETDWLSEYPFEYKHIAMENLERKIAALKLDVVLCVDQKLRDSLKSSEILLQQLNESISADEYENQKGLQAEVDSLKENIKFLETDKETIKSERNAVMEENRELKDTVIKLEKELFQVRLQGNDVLKETKKLLETVTQLEKESCQASLKHISARVPYYNLDDFNLQHSSSNKIQVTSVGSFQDVFIQIDGISILLDPLGTDLLEDEYQHHYDYYKENIKARDELHKLSLDAVVLSTCLYSCTATTVKKIVEKSPRVKWLTPAELKDWLVRIGVNETSIMEFGILEEKDIRFGHSKITFVCTKTNINSTSIHRKKCNSCGWIIKGSHRTFYSSGITNYHESDFKVVAERYSPIHLALLPISLCVRNMSCLPEFTVTSNEVIKMHADVGSQQSLGLHSGRHYGSAWDETCEREFNQEMMKLQLNPSTFHFLIPGVTYKSK